MNEQATDLAGIRHEVINQMEELLRPFSATEVSGDNMAAELLNRLANIIAGRHRVGVNVRKETAESARGFSTFFLGTSNPRGEVTPSTSRKKRYVVRVATKQGNLELIYSEV